MKHEFEIETVAQVDAVARETVLVSFYEGDAVVQIMGAKPYGELQFISFPVAKAREIAATLIGIADAAGQVP